MTSPAISDIDLDGILGEERAKSSIENGGAREAICIEIAVDKHAFRVGDRLFKTIHGFGHPIQGER
jgi:hypothetical protein